MKSRLKYIIFAVILASAAPVNGAEAYNASERNINGFDVKYISIDMKDSAIKPLLLTANNSLSSKESVVSMSEYAGAFAAVSGSPVSSAGEFSQPVGPLIREGKPIHAGNGLTVGITKTGGLIIDHIAFDIFGYVNGELKAIPWGINQIISDDNGIVVFTPEYGAPVPVDKGCRAVIVSDGLVFHITSLDFLTPPGGFALLYNPGVVYMIGERYKIGDEVSYDYKIKTVKTSPADWESVVVAVGAEIDLIINDELTAGQGFKTLSANDRWRIADRSFIGSSQDGKLVIGTVSNTTISGLSSICQSLGLKNAACLDSSDSISLYHNDSIAESGKDVNNSIGFVDINSIGALQQTAVSVTANEQKVSVGGAVYELRGYNVGGYNYFMLRDLAYILRNSRHRFGVEWSGANRIIYVNKGRSYNPDGTELSKKGVFATRQAQAGNASLVVDGTSYNFVVYNFDGNNYFKIRDLGEAIDFPVEWDAESKTIII